MLTLRSILGLKGSDVVCVSPAANVLEAVEVMSRRGIGSVLILEEDVLVGIFTERDAVERVLVKRRDPATTLMNEVMARVSEIADPDMSMMVALTMMTERRIRHLPVGSLGRVVGIVSMGDLAKCAAQDLDRQVSELGRYIGGPSVQRDTRWTPSFQAASREAASFDRDEASVEDGAAPDGQPAKGG